MVDHINAQRKANESIGGVFEVLAFGLVPGPRLARELGGAPRRPPRRRRSARSRRCKGVAFGDGFDLAGARARRRTTRSSTSEERGFYRETNRAGGLEGGMTTGEPLVVRGAMKPLPTLTKPLRSVDIATREPAQALRERTDSCRRARGRRRGGGDGRVRARRRLPAQVRRRPHRRRPRGASARYEERIGWLRSPLTRALVLIGFMGAGKSTAAREAAAALGEPRPTPTRCSRPSSAARSRRSSPARARRRSARARRRSCASCSTAPAGASIALGGGAVLSERMRAALGAPHRRARRRRPRDRVGARRRARAARWPATATRSRALLRRARARSTRRRRRVPAAGDRATRTSRAARSRRCARRPRRARRLLWATRASGEYPVLRRRGRARARAVAGARAALPRHRRDGRAALRGALRRGGGDAIAIAPGEQHKTLATAERVWRALAARGRDPRATTSSRSAAASSATSPGSAPRPTSAGSRSSRSRRRSSPRSTRPTAARPASTCPRPRTTSAPTTSPRPCSSTPALLETLPPEELAAGYAEVVKTALIAGGPLWERVARRRARRRRRDRRLRADEARRRRRRRARRRPPPGPQPRPHRRPRDRDRHRLRALPPRRGRRARPARRAAPVRPGRRCARRSRELLGGARAADRARDGVDPEAVARRDARATRSASAADGAVRPRPRARRRAPRRVRRCRRRCAPPCES